MYAITPFDSKWQNLQMSSITFLHNLLPFTDITILILPLIVGQGHGVQFSQLHHSLANVKIYKCLRDMR